MNLPEGDAVVAAAIILTVGWVIAHIAKRGLSNVPDTVLSAHGRSIARHAVNLVAAVVFVAMAIQQLGFDITVVLGAAGILSVAVGFASQTSASNLISGLFLVGERPFSVGDVIRADGVTGEVLSIDLLSVKLRTFDNLYVRIPNENLMKSTTTTLSRFPIRRYDLQVGIAYGEDLRRARDVLLRVAKEFHLCLDDPKPIIIMQGFGESSVDLQFSVWALRERYLDLRNGLQERVKEAFDREGIEIPFPHRTLYAGTHSQPMPVRVVRDEP